MPKSKISYRFFSSFIIRTPVYPIDFYKNLTKGLFIESDAIKEILKNAPINEALFLASPELYAEIRKWLTQEDYPIDKASKIKLSVLKYFIRMSTRCTPFGLFAACGAGKLANETVINIDKEKSFRRKTRFDMQFLANSVSELTANPTIQNQLLFYPNSTLYQLGDFYRYVEYTLHQNKRKYSLEALKRTDYLDLILQKAIVGARKKELALVLISEEISKKEAMEFIEELIFNQILVSELEPTLTGSSSLNPFSGERDIENINKEVVAFGGFYDKLNNQLLKIDTKIGNFISCYEDIIATISKTNIPFDEKYLFQTDLFLDSDNLQLEKEYSFELLRTIDLLNKISEKPKNTALENFKKAFVERYESEAIPLVKALDVETGIGYLQQSGSFDVTPLLDSLAIRQKVNPDNHQISLNKAEKIIYKKLQNALQNNENNIILNLSDFDNIDFSGQNLPATFSCLFEIVEEQEKEWVVIQSIGGSSAANLLARFCYGDSGINDLANEITQYESENYSDKILAEIVHLPESRTGNVLRRPSFRAYEIPYLGQASLPTSHQINIEDLVLFVKNDRLVLWSKKQDKEVIPRLTNAHNYSYNALPIYHFLCDMQFENCKPSIGLHWDNLEKLFDYFPRVTIKNCIVSKAKWVFSKEKHPEFFKILTIKEIIYDKNIFSFASHIPSLEVNELLPQYVSLADGDNALIINLENSTCIEMLIETVKNRSQFVLEEFLFPSSKVVTGKTDCYANQFIVGLKRDKS
ncbi:hypothetical protein E0I61_09740 [Flavobacterium ranwuense]|uniref:Lantibiotic dehydratase N-terminal domain-containing protein n=1 Tax=Flavobacterium ranwuense TaxID=2541725 RepID=A0ABY2DRU1_9FLAO|nr:lantibiotic dehydratase family protein [Flavobacterium ranwuense]TDE29427.1 hypothetical protein E0I61_09740 [Flavobacterium ranwuense]